MAIDRQQPNLNNSNTQTLNTTPTADLAADTFFGSSDFSSLPFENIKVNEDTDDGSVEFIFGDGEDSDDMTEVEAVDFENIESVPDEIFYENLAEEMSEDDLEAIATEVLENFENDKASRADWESTIVKGFKLLGLELEDGNQLFEGACTAYHPLILESAVKFQSKATAEILPSGGPVRTQILGDIDEAKEAQASRIKSWMNYQLTTQMPEYYPDTERMLFYLPIVGSAFKKCYYYERFGRPKSEFTPADQFVCPYYASSLEDAPRYSHVLYKTKNELLKDSVSGLYRMLSEDELGEPCAPEYSDLEEYNHRVMGLNPSLENELYTLVEQHGEFFIESDPFADPNGIASPYIVTVDKASQKVLSIRRNWKKEDTNRDKIIWFVHYPFVPGMGFYGVGFIHLLGNLQLTLTTVLRSLVDSGQFANLQGGFKAKGLRWIGDNGPIGPGEWREVEATGVELAKSLFPIPYKEPSNVLFQMLSFLESRGQKFADSTEQVIADSTNYGPVGTTMALLEASTKFFTAIHKRLHFSQKKELRILHNINGMSLQEEYPYDVPGESRTIFKSDFDGKIDVIPVSDPNISSKAHRMTKSQTVLQVAQVMPDEFDRKALLRKILLEMDFGDVDDILPPKEEATPNDPITDIQRVSEGKPIKAFPGQNHDAHIATKTAFLQDPSLGGSPVLGASQAPLQANIREHMLLKYQEQIAGVVSQQQPQNGEMDPKLLEAIIAEAAQRVAMANKAAQAQGGMTDPEMIVAQAELKKAATQEKKVEYDNANTQIKNALDKMKLDLSLLEMASDENTKRLEISTDLVKDRLKHGVNMVQSALENANKVNTTTTAINDVNRNQ